MKTFRLFGTALLAVFMGFNLVACSDDENDYNENGTLPVPPAASAKKLTSIEFYSDGKLYAQNTFTYDEKGHLVKTVESDIMSYDTLDFNYTFIWKDNHIICKDDFGQYSFNLEKGKVVSCIGGDEMYNDSYRYDKYDQLIAFGNSEKTEWGRIWFDLEWKDGKVVGIVQEPIEDYSGGRIVLEYGKDSKGYCPCIYWLLSMNTEIHIPQPELFGKVMKALPVKMVVYNNDKSMEDISLIHTLDKDGYVTSSKVTSVYKNADGKVIEEEGSKEIFTYTWE